MRPRDGDEANTRRIVAWILAVSAGTGNPVVHNARNEGTEPVVYATFMLPDGGALREDVANPGVCAF